MDDFEEIMDMDSRDKLLDAIKKHGDKLKAIQQLPEYQEFLKYKRECNLFAEFIEQKRMDKTIEIIEGIFNKDYKNHKNIEPEVNVWLERITKMEKRLSDSAYNRHESFCSSNVMDHVWKCVSKIGKPIEINSMFGGGAYTIGDYVMETYHGQGEYGYAIYKLNRIF
ncbi:MAG: hypothetical protein AABY15_02820 [Nanoarchaeota archaeon]